MGFDLVFAIRITIIECELGFDPTNVYFFDVGEPNVIVLVSQELCLHLEHLDLAYFLQIITDFEALLLTVFLILLILQHAQFFVQPTVIVAYLSLSGGFGGFIDRCKEVDLQMFSDADRVFDTALNVFDFAPISVTFVKHCGKFKLGLHFSLAARHALFFADLFAGGFETGYLGVAL